MVGERSRSTDCADQGSSIPLMKRRCDVAAASDASPSPIPMEVGSQPGCGVTWNMCSQVEASALNDQRCGGNMSVTWRRREGPRQSWLGLYTILRLPLLYSIYCNNGGSGAHTILRNRVGDDRGGGCLNKGWVRTE